MAGVLGWMWAELWQEVVTSEAGHGEKRYLKLHSDGLVLGMSPTLSHRKHIDSLGQGCMIHVVLDGVGAMRYGSDFLSSCIFHWRSQQRKLDLSNIFPSSCLQNEPRSSAWTSS